MALDFSDLNALILGNGNPVAERAAAQFLTQGATVFSGYDGSALMDQLGDRSADVLVVALEGKSAGTAAALDPLGVVAALDTMLKPAVDALAVVLPRMRAAGRGRIVFCIPSMGIFGADKEVEQSVAAAALLALGRSVAIGNADSGVVTNMLSYVAATPATETLFKDHPLLDGRIFMVDALIPAITYLAHETCPLQGEVISAAAGRFARLVTMVTLGGFNPAIADDEIVALMPKIMDMRSTISPRSVMDELITVIV